MNEKLLKGQEILGLSDEKDLSDILKYLLHLAHNVAETMEAITIPRSEIDPRILKLEDKLNELNRDRAANYGWEYLSPQVIYINSLLFTKTEELIQKGEGNGIAQTLNSGGVFLHLENTILVHCRSFEDLDIDAFYTSYLLRHEMAHAGSVMKLQAYESGVEELTLESYRLGAFLLSRKKGELGEGFTEGHNSLEDQQALGLLKEKPWKSRWLKKGVGNFAEEYRAEKTRLETIRKKLVESGRLFPEQPLTGYWEKELPEGKSGEMYSSADDYKEYTELMIEIYDRDPVLYGLAENLIYGDKMLFFAKRIEQVFGKSFFRELMMVSSHEQAAKLLAKIRFFSQQPSYYPA